MGAFMKRKQGRDADIEDHYLIRGINKVEEQAYKFRRWEGRPPYEMSCWGRM